MSDKITAILKECEARLLEHRQLLQEALEKGGQQDDPPAVMIIRTMDFGLQTIKAVDLLVKTDISNSLLACTLTRAFFEAAVRVLWACRTLPGSQHPWIRLQVYWATEDLKWAKSAKNAPELAEHAESIRMAREEVRNRTDSKGEAVTPAPNIRDMLGEIEKANVARGLGTGRLSADYLYTNLYRILSEPAHGHPGALGKKKPDTFLPHARIGLVVASGYLLEASCHVGTTDPQKEIAALAARIAKIAEDTPEEPS